MLAFDKIKKPITHALVLVSPNPYQPLNLFAYTTKDTITIFLSHTNVEDHENPNTFMSIAFKLDKLNYTLVKNICVCCN